MPARRSTPRRTRTPSSGTRGRKKQGGLLHLAKMAPLAIALASTQLPHGQQTLSETGAPQKVTIQQGRFEPVCALPFAGVRNPASDDHCGILGGSSDIAKQQESQAKNNFCAATQPIQPITYEQLINLQAMSAAIPKRLPSRKAVEALGEGKYVSYIALIKEAHYSDTARGEAVNCNLSGNEPNDIHVVLMPDPRETDECKSTTAEMSPHFRPPAWTPENLNAIGRPVRIEGQLFYDGSHTPCSATSRPNPKRASLWEIHPVYSVDVCEMTDIDKCRNSTNPADWVPLEQALSSENQ